MPHGANPHRAALNCRPGEFKPEGKQSSTGTSAANMISAAPVLLNHGNRLKEAAEMAASLFSQRITRSSHGTSAPNNRRS